MNFHKYRKRADVYKKLFATDEGQAFLKYLAIECNAFSATYVSGDSLATAFNEGKRQVYNHIVGVVQQNPEILHKLFQQDLELEQLEQMTAQEDNIYDGYPNGR